MPRISLISNFFLFHVNKSSDWGFMYSCITLTGSSRFSLIFNEDICKRWHAVSSTADTLTKAKKKKLMNESGGGICYRKSFPMQNVAKVPVLQRIYNNISRVGLFSKRASPKENMCMVCYASESHNNERQLRLLDSYFAKLPDDDANQISSDTSNKKTELLHNSGEINAKKTLDSLDSYLEKLNKGPDFKNNMSSSFDYQTTESNQVATPFSVSKSSERVEKGELKGYKWFRSRDGGSHLVRPQALQQNDEISNLYLISTLVSVNIAVFLFEIASPISNSEFELFSIPLLYGAKINDLILVGEWWRLVTPMFLHSGLFHVALGCWALLNFGPQVCKSYGSFTFFLIYTLGGFSGNLTSFLHTPEPTVGGTGPVFAIIGAWLIYQMQNKEVIAKDISESMFQKAITATTLSFIISYLGPIDNWTHLGAAFTGIIYGFFTCPMVQVDDASSRTSQEERITLVRQYANPCKSLLVFTIFIIALSSLLFVVEPPLDMLAP